MSPTSSSVPGPATTTVVIVAAAIMGISMGVRQCFGLFLQPITQDLAISATSFGFALAIQNLIWGTTQPFVGALGDRFGPRPVLIGCGVIYALGLYIVSSSSSVLGLELGIGAFVGLGVAGTGFGVLLGAVSRAAPPERASQLLGLVSGAGSVGVLALAPVGQMILELQDWRIAFLFFAAVCASMVLLALPIGGKPQKKADGGRRSQDPELRLTDAVREAMSHGGFVAMTVAFFACGFQLMFITAHLPRFLGLCGLAPSVGATALGVIGVCNAIGSYMFGHLGARYSRKRLLAAIYAIRTLAIAGYISVPVTETTTFIFAAVMGFTWLGVVPLVSGLIGRLFGLGHFNMLFGVLFFCHQLGGFLGPLIGGWVLDTSGSYQLAWYSMVGIGAIATVLQWPMNDVPREPAGRAVPA